MLHSRKSKNCFVCSKPTNGSFNDAKKDLDRLRVKKIEILKKWNIKRKLKRRRPIAFSEDGEQREEEDDE